MPPLVRVVSLSRSVLGAVLCWCASAHVHVHVCSSAVRRTLCAKLGVEYIEPSEDDDMPDVESEMSRHHTQQEGAIEAASAADDASTPADETTQGAQEDEDEQGWRDR